MCFALCLHCICVGDHIVQWVDVDMCTCAHVVFVNRHSKTDYVSLLVVHLVCPPLICSVHYQTINLQVNSSNFMVCSSRDYRPESAL